MLHGHAVKHFPRTINKSIQETAPQEMEEGVLVDYREGEQEHIPERREDEHPGVSIHVIRIAVRDDQVKRMGPRWPSGS